MANALGDYGGYSADDPRNNVGRGAVSRAIGALGAKFKSWGREEQGLPAAEPVIDLSGPAASLSAWDERQRNGVAPVAVSPVVAPAAAASAPTVVVSPKPAAKPVQSVRRTAALGGTPTAISQPDETGMSGWVQGADGSWGPPAATAAAPVDTRTAGERIFALHGPKGLGAFIGGDIIDNGGFATQGGRTFVLPKRYASESAPDAPVAAAPVAERDTSLDPGSQGAWARELNARNLLAATGGSKGLTALSAYDATQLAPVVAQTKARGDMATKLIENQGKLAETDLKGKYDNNGHLIDAKGNLAVAGINGEFGNQRELIAGGSRERVALTNRDATVESAVIGGGSRVKAAEVTGGKADIVPAALQYSEEMKSFAKQQEQIDAARLLIGKDKDGSKKAALDAKEAALNTRRKLLQQHASR